MVKANHRTVNLEEEMTGYMQFLKRPSHLGKTVLLKRCECIYIKQIHINGPPRPLTSLTAVFSSHHFLTTSRITSPVIHILHSLILFSPFTLSESPIPPNKHHQIISSASYTSPIHSYNHLPGVNLLKDYMLVTPLLHHLFPETCSHHFVFCLSGSSSSMFTVSSSFFCCFIPIIFLTFQLCPIIPTPSLSLLAPLRQETNSLLPYSVPLYSSPGIKSPPIPKHL